MALKNRSERLASREFLPRCRFCGDFGEGGGKGRLGHMAWNYNRPVGISEHVIPGVDQNSGAENRHIPFDHSAATLRIQRADAAVEHRKAHAADSPDISDQS